MRFIAVLNKEIGTGAVINALGHMSFGLGHRLEGFPQEIHVYLADSNAVREFRNIVVKRLDRDGLMSDFPHTMSGGDTNAQQLLTSQTLETELIYYGICLLVEKIDPTITEFLSGLSMMKEFATNSTGCKLIASKAEDFNVDEKKKISMLVNGKVSLQSTISAIIIASCKVGQKVQHADLCLVNLLDKSGNLHANISYHPFPILKADTIAKHIAMVNNAAEHAQLITNTVWGDDNQPLATVVFGNQDVVDSVILRKQTRMYATATY